MTALRAMIGVVVQGFGFALARARSLRQRSGTSAATGPFTPGPSNITSSLPPDLTGSSGTRSTQRAAAWLVAMGLAFAPAWALALACVAYAAGTIIRTRAEDALMAATFGAVFEEYRRRVPALIPRVG